MIRAVNLSASRTLTAPLSYRQFRFFWIASLFSNFGFLIFGVGAAWSMAMLSKSDALVALVQTALILPFVFVSPLAGALADMVDRRKLAMSALAISFSGALGLSLFASLDALSPSVILAFCVVAGAGMALFAPTGQVSIKEQVPAEALSPAVALSQISFNLARSFGPAIGGLIVVVGGAVTSFAVNALFCLPMICTLYFWKRIVAPLPLARERLSRAVISGFRYAMHTPRVRVTVMRAVVPSFGGSALIALLPLVARDLLLGDAMLYGILLGSFGLGAVAGAFVIEPARHNFTNETILLFASVIMALAFVVVAISGLKLLTLIAVFLAGGAWIGVTLLFTVVVQLSVPDWVMGRAVTICLTMVTGGFALGSAIWGALASQHSIAGALVAAGGCLLLSPLLGIRYRMPQAVATFTDDYVEQSEPEVVLTLDNGSGPIIVELEYQVDPERMEFFSQHMRELRMIRQRNGAYDWSLARNIAKPEHWIERFRCPTWLDLQHHRNRVTQAERDVERAVAQQHREGGPIRVRYFLERRPGSD